MCRFSEGVLVWQLRGQDRDGDGAVGLQLGGTADYEWKTLFPQNDAHAY